jgi:hypothetical protein
MCFLEGDSPVDHRLDERAGEEKRRNASYGAGQ